jgi:hypothetical protein
MIACFLGDGQKMSKRGIVSSNYKVFMGIVPMFNSGLSSKIGRSGKFDICLEVENM